jgi:lactate dehydrogenase-like 2-hydroxyacid dehydrogenase
MKPVVVLTATYPAIVREILSGLCEFVEHPTEQRSEEEMITILSEADAAITLRSDPLTRNVLAANPGLRMIANYAAGYNNIDIDAAREFGIIVTNTPGALVDEVALCDALAEGQIGGAGLDVYENEPRVSPRLLSMRNVVLVPHIGSATQEMRSAMARIAATDVALFLRGEKPLHAVV